MTINIEGVGDTVVPDPFSGNTFDKKGDEVPVLSSGL